MAEIAPLFVELEPHEAVALRGEVPIPELSGFFERAFAAVADAIEAAGVEVAGPPFGFYPEQPGETVVVEAGFPVSERVEPDAPVHRLVLPGGRAIEVVHVGSFETLQQTYSQLEAWMAESGVRPGTAMWECYLSDPRTEPDPSTTDLGRRTKISFDWVG